MEPETVAGPPVDLIADVFARDCPSRTVIDHVVSKWGTLALVALAESSYRFNALRRRVDGISEKMLSQTLQALERDGMVVREVHSAIPPHVEYSLTELGEQVAARLRELIDLVESSLDEVLAARRGYDTSAA